MLRTIHYLFPIGLLMFGHQAMAASYTWNGSALDQNWGTATNWTPLGGPPVPGSNDIAIFVTGSPNYPTNGVNAGSGTLELNGQSSSIALNFIGASPLSITNTLPNPAFINSINGNNQISATTTLLNCTITTSAGSLTFLGSTSIPGKTLNVAGPLTIQGSGITEWSGANDFTLAQVSLSSTQLKLSHLGAFGNFPGFSPPIELFMTSSSLIIGVNDFEMSSFLVTLNGSEYIDTNGLNAKIQNSISGVGTLNKTGLGRLILNNPLNSYSGGTNIHAGILGILHDTDLGNTATTLTISDGATLEVGSSFTFSPNRTIVLNSGNATIDTLSFLSTVASPILGSGSLNKTGTGTLFLTNGSNSYQGGTNLSSGTINILQDSNLGSGTLALANASTLQAGASFSLNTNRSVILNGGIALIDTNGFSPSIQGTIQGSGGLHKLGVGSLTLLGANSYSGGTQISTGSLIGNTTSLQGSIDLINPGASLIIDQSGSGLLSSMITGPNLSLFTVQGGGQVTIDNSQPSFLGQSLITGSSSLTLNGNMSQSDVTINAGSKLQGVGVVGSVVNHGQIVPGSLGSGTLSMQGSLNFGIGGSLVSQMTPTSGSSLDVSGVANLANGIEEVQFLTGFYGISGTRTLLTAGLVSGTFSSLVLEPHIQGNLIYDPTSVQLSFLIKKPFLQFPFANANERSVGNNLDAIFSSGSGFSNIITGTSSDPTLATIVDSLVGQSDSDINHALDQMHPAAMSAFAELQTELGGQLLSLFHKNPSQRCGCTSSSRLWVLPFGNWLKEKKEGMEIGFRSTTRGVATGFDQQFFGCWTLGIGGAYQASDLKWSLDRGYSYIQGFYGSLYTDLILDNWYLGASAYAGKNEYDTARKLKFTIVDAQAKSNAGGLDCACQLTTAYFFGAPSCLLYPYATVDYLYLKNGSFSEKGAGSLNLKVDPYDSSSLRAESGITFRFIDRNRDETICIAPLFSIGYVLDLPLKRDLYQSTFANQTISFQTQGWDRAVQLLNLRFGLDLSYRCLTLQSDYIADISPDRDTPFFNQRANFRLAFHF